MDQRFATEDIPTAKEFVERLRPTHPDWGGKDNWSPDWIFRGQSNSNFTLTPSAWRHAAEGEKQSESEKLVKQMKTIFEPDFYSTIEEPLALHNEAFSSRSIREVLLQAYTEFIIVREFIDFADSLGFQTPGASEFPEDRSQFIWRYFRSLRPKGFNTEAENFRLNIWRNSTVALAQHHGIPTRLLDWTRRPLYAAFFAAEGVDRSKSEEDLIAVFALHRDSLHNKVESFTVPRSENPYLRAQDGVFTIDTGGDNAFEITGIWRHLEIVQDIYPESSILQPKKLTLPSSQVGELIRLLSLENISRAHLMPNLDNVTRSLKKKWDWISRSDL